MTTTDKSCTKCGVVQPLCEFSPHRLGLGGVRSICKRCSSQLTMRARAEHENSRESARRAQRRFSRTTRGAEAKSDNQRKAYAENPAAYMLSRAKQRAISKGLEFSISESDFVIPAVCPVFGTLLSVANKKFREPGFSGSKDSMSLDRLDSSKGYVPGNVAVISWRANRIKGDATLAELQAVVAWLESLTSVSATGGP